MRNFLYLIYFFKKIFLKNLGLINEKFNFFESRTALFDHLVEITILRTCQIIQEKENLEEIFEELTEITAFLNKNNFSIQKFVKAISEKLTTFSKNDQFLSEIYFYLKKIKQERVISQKIDDLVLKEIGNSRLHDLRILEILEEKIKLKELIEFKGQKLNFFLFILLKNSYTIDHITFKKSISSITSIFENLEKIEKTIFLTLFLKKISKYCFSENSTLKSTEYQLLYKMINEKRKLNEEGKISTEFLKQRFLYEELKILKEKMKNGEIEDIYKIEEEFENVRNDGVLITRLKISLIELNCFYFLLKISNFFSEEEFPEKNGFLKFSWDFLKNGINEDEMTLDHIDVFNGILEEIEKSRVGFEGVGKLKKLEILERRN